MMGLIPFVCLSPFIALLIDLLIGDPRWMVHPVVIMGKATGFLEKKLRNAFPATEEGERRAGRILAAVLPSASALLSGGFLFLLSHLGRAGLCAAVVTDIFWGYQSIAVKDMLKESRNVFEKLPGSSKNGGGSLSEARKAVGRIVGRDTERLTEEGVIRAAVESVAESFSDGMFAPMLFYSLLGAPLALCYKAVNTMDSMTGYKNERYINFGRAPARLDDAANFIPSRISALLIIAAACIDLKWASAKRAFYIWRRDRFNHASPNSAQTEAAMAGALGIRLGGSAWDFGKLYDKPFIGDELKRIEGEDILRANRLYLIAAILGTVLGCVLRCLTLRLLLI